MASRRILLIAVDGFGGTIDGRSSLSLLRTTNLDMLARKGRTGFLPNATLIGLLGHTYAGGRGPLESAGAGVDVRDGDLCWRADFAMADENGVILEPRASLDPDDAAALAGSLSEIVLDYGGAEATFVPTVGHRAVLRIRADNPLSANVPDAPVLPVPGAGGPDERVLPGLDPGGPDEGVATRYEDRVPTADDTAARMSASITSDWRTKARRVLSEHPVNAALARRGRIAGTDVLLRGADVRLPSFPLRRTTACIATLPVVHGIAVAAQMQRVDADPAWVGLAAQAVEALDEWETVVVHSEVSEDTLEDFDDAFLGTLLPELNRGVLVCLAGTPGPFVVAGGLISPDGTRAFTEADCAAGALRDLAQTQLMGVLDGAARE